jgi:NADH dehydrogenase FAD-containing subunit
VHSRAELLSSESLPSDFKSKVLQLLHEGGVDVVFGNRVVDIKQEATIEQEKEISGVCLSGGTVIPADTVIYATSSATPATEFLPSEALGKNGSIPILQTYVLLCPAENHFPKFSEF